jgi:hypothetical protein
MERAHRSLPQLPREAQIKSMRSTMCCSLNRKSSSIRYRHGLEQAFVGYGTHAGWGILPWQERGKKHVLSGIYHLAKEVFWASLLLVEGMFGG